MQLRFYKTHCTQSLQIRTSILHQLCVCVKVLHDRGITAGTAENYSKYLPLSSERICLCSQVYLQLVPHLNISISSSSIQKQTSVYLTATLIHFINKQLRILLQVARVAHSINGVLCRVRHDAIRMQLFIIERLGTALLDHKLQPFSCVRVSSPITRSLLKVFIALPLCL